jgi:hypothetical protein
MKPQDIPNLTAKFQEQLTPMMDMVGVLKKALADAISTCVNSEKRLQFECLLTSINDQQAEIMRVIPPMVAENEAKIRAGVQQLRDAKAEADTIGERIEELKKQADEIRIKHEAREAERASQPAEPTATDLAHEYLKGLSAAAPAVNLPLNEGKTLVEHLLGLGAKPEAPTPPAPKPKRLGNIWENWEPHSTESFPDTDSP